MGFSLDPSRGFSRRREALQRLQRRSRDVSQSRRRFLPSIDGLESRRLLAITPFVTETGLISLSLDALGTTSSEGFVQVDKPAGATVRSAHLFSATTPGGRVILPNHISVNGTPITAWDDQLPSGINSNNYRADVTSILKPTIDAAAPGLINVRINELDSFTIDGEILAVIFDDPNQTASNTIVLLFGAQAPAGETFSIGLAEPIDTSDPNLSLDMSLGISFGFQSSGQFSTVDVNGERLTSSAGGQDDGAPANGALITVGGIGDTNANPDPDADDSGGPRTDDELYSLLPFVNDGDTSISVFTTNPSNDDNIFFAALNLGGTTAVVGEGILLSPLEDTLPVGSTATATATLQDDLGNPITNRLVTFTILSGPNAGLTDSILSDSNGEAVFSYISTLAGTDEIQASFVNSEGDTVTSNTVTRTFEEAETTLEVESIVVEDGRPQRSKVREITVTFTELAEIDADAFEIEGTTGDVDVAFTTSEVSGKTVARLTFSGPGVDALTDSLKDGRYTLTVVAQKVRDSSGVELAEDHTFDFHRFFGDSNGDAIVDAIDYSPFRTAYLSGVATGLNSIYDFNGDGAFTSADLSAFNTNFRRRRL
jgi:hypothetical protein